ncbi:MAG: hypothetical protein VXZ40_03450 [Nanoarchaeota archaeon]|nr:hypothetical protein [Nanoarchaeota archaeon]
MATKKGATKKSTKASVTINDQISPEEHSIIEESFNLIKNLNSQVSQVEKAKDKLATDVTKLAKKIDTHDAKKHYNSLFTSIKEEIIKDFAPLLKKLDLKGVKVDVFSEISNLLEVEISKVRSEFETSSKKTKKDFQKSLSDIEVRVVDALKEHALLRNELKDLDSKEITKSIAKLEKKLDKSLEKISLKSEVQLQTSLKEVTSMKTSLSKQSKDLSKSLKEFESLKDNVLSKISEEELDFTAFESKVLSLQKEMDSMKSLVGRFEDDLYSDSALQLVKKVEKKLLSLDTSFKELQSFSTTQLETLATQLEGIGDIESSVNESLMVQSKQQEKLSKEVNKLKESFQEDKKQKKQELAIKEFKEKSHAMLKKEADSFKTKLQEQFSLDFYKLKEKSDMELESITSQTSVLKEELLSFKSQSQELLKNYLDELHHELQEITSVSKQNNDSITIFEEEVNQKIKDLEHAQEGSHSFISSKYNEIVDSFESLSNEQKKELSLYKKQLEENSSSFISSVETSLKEKLSEEILKLQEFKTHSQTSLKEFQREISEDVESKLVTAQDLFKKEFEEHVSTFDDELKQKESEFLSKLLIIEEDKKAMVAELHDFKGEIANLTKQYSESLTIELDNLKKEDLEFEDKKKEFLSHVDDVIHVRRVQLEEDFEHYKAKLSGFTTDIRTYFTEQDNSFRTSFNEKVSSLHEYLSSSISKLEKKFIEKNVSKVKLELDTEFKRLHEIAEQLESRELELTKNLEIAEQKELDFFESLHLEQKVLQEKVEERLMSLEKQFNKRFLDFDNQFANFKGIVVEEVEDLMKEVQSLVKQKFDVLDNYETKLKVLVNEGERKIHELHDVQSIVDREVRDIRDELNDLRVKVDVETPEFDVNSLSSLVSTMTEYENHLIGLVETLKHKGVSDSHILDVLSTKGHPRVYAKMILDSMSLVKKQN